MSYMTTQDVGEDDPAALGTKKSAIVFIYLLTGAASAQCHRVDVRVNRSKSPPLGNPAFICI